MTRYLPDGVESASVELPVSQPPKCAFGGPDLATLFVTSARVGLTEADLADQPLAGSVFAFPVDVPGVAPYRWGTPE